MFMCFRLSVSVLHNCFGFSLSVSLGSFMFSITRLGFGSACAYLADFRCHWRRMLSRTSRIHSIDGIFRLADTFSNSIFFGFVCTRFYLCLLLFILLLYSSSPSGLLVFFALLSLFVRERRTSSSRRVKSDRLDRTICKLCQPCRYWFSRWYRSRSWS